MTGNVTTRLIPLRADFSLSVYFCVVFSSLQSFSQFIEFKRERGEFGTPLGSFVDLWTQCTNFIFFFKKKISVLITSQSLFYLINSMRYG